jgi:hypothetical protein
MSGRLQFWLQRHDGAVPIWLGNRLSDVRFVCWLFFTSEGREQHAWERRLARAAPSPSEESGE